jgi:quercetin dioxygenase-like cupin family protein
VLPGEAAFFRRDTWHHAFVYGPEPLRVLEYFAPPPSQGTSGAYARTKPLLTTSRYTQEGVLGRWPLARTEIEHEQSIRVIGDGDLLWRLEGEMGQALTGLLISTEHLTVGKMLLEPGHRSSVHSHPGDECLYLLDGALHMLCPEKEGQRWFELSPGDGFYVPAGAPHQYYNISGKPVTVLFGVAPTYE